MRKIFMLFTALFFALGMMATDVMSINFTQGQGNWTINNVNLDGLSRVWQQNSSYGMKASAYVSGVSHATESWLVSPVIDLSDATSATLSFTHALNYGGNSNLHVIATTDPNYGWVDLSVDSWPAGNNWTFINATADLSSVVGSSTVQVAFVYTSTTDEAVTWEIKTVNVSANIQSPVYYLVGSMTDWQPVGGYQFAANPNVSGEYLLDVTLNANDEFKVVKTLDGTINTWYPDGATSNYIISERGNYTIYFHPEGDLAGGYYNFYYAEKKTYPRYDVAEAIAAGLQENDEIEVRGVVTRMEIKGSNFARFGSVIMYVADANGQEGEFEFYNCYALNADTFKTTDPAYDAESTDVIELSSVSDANGNTVHVGDTVIAYGKYQFYNSTKHELQTGCYLIDVRTVPEDIYISATSGVNYVDNVATSGWWLISFTNEDYTISISNNYSQQAEGTYPVDELYHNDSYININGATVYFGGGSVTLSIAEGTGNIIVAGMLVGEDGNNYHIYLEYVMPVVAYYLVGSMTDWQPAEGYQLTANPSAEGEYTLEIALNANDEVKVVKTFDGTIDTWYPGGATSNYVVYEKGDYTVYFRPDGALENGYYGYFYPEKKTYPRYDVAEAIAAGLQENDEIEVRGVVTKMEIKGKNFARYGSVIMYVADANGQEGEFIFYNCYALNADTFRTSYPAYDAESTEVIELSSVTDANGRTVHVGDTVIAFGKYQFYNSTKHELQTGCYLVDIRTAPQDIYVNITSGLAFFDYIAESNVWQIYEEDVISIAAQNSQIAGTYAASDLYSNYSWIYNATLRQYISFTSGFITVTETSGNVVVSGTLEGIDGNNYHLYLEYVAPVAETEATVIVPEAAFDDTYWTTSELYQVSGMANDTIGVRLAIWSGTKSGSFTENDLYYEWSYIYLYGEEVHVTDAEITVVENEDGSYTVTADLLCPNNILYHVTMTVPYVPAEYYLVGSMTDWQPAEGYQFTENPSVEGEYTLEIALNANDEVKVVKTLNGTIDTWYPGGSTSNYVVSEKGTYTVYFRPDGTLENGYYNYFYPEKHATPRYEVAEAIAAGLNENDEIEVRGVVTKIEFKGKNFAKYGSANIYVADATGAEGVFEFYNCYSLNADTFRTSDPAYDATSTAWAEFDKVADENGNEIHVGDTVIAFGKYKLYGTTHELNTGCYIVDVRHKPEDIYINATSGLRYADNTATYGWWDMLYEGEEFTMELSNLSSTQAPGTYTVEQLDPDYSYISYSDGSRITFVAGSVTLAEISGTIVVNGTLTGSDGNYYHFNLEYVVPVAETEATVIVPEAVFDDSYLASSGLYQVYGMANDTIGVILAIGNDKKPGTYTEANLYYDWSYVYLNGAEVHVADAEITVVKNADGSYTVTADLLCMNNTLYHVTMTVPAPVAESEATVVIPEAAFDDTYWTSDGLYQVYGLANDTIGVILAIWSETKPGTYTEDNLYYNLSYVYLNEAEVYVNDAVITVVENADGSYMVNADLLCTNNVLYHVTMTVPASVITAIDNVKVESKAVKRIENGTVVIYRNGVKYNINGQRVR